jgi:hypothetical protein
MCYPFLDVLKLNILGSESDLFEGFGNVESSRLSTDFQIIRWLGKGGYGDVVLARYFFLTQKC